MHRLFRRGGGTPTSSSSSSSSPSSAAPTRGPGASSSSLSICQQRNVLSPLYLGMALMETAAAGEAWRGPALPPPSEMWKGPEKHSRVVGAGEPSLDPVEGQGGIGMALRDYDCGVCGCGGGGGEGGGGGNVLFFACGHMYHRSCLPELACILCLKENFPQF